MTPPTPRATDQQILGIAHLEGPHQLVAALLLAFSLGLRVEGAECIAMIGTDLTLMLVRGQDGRLHVDGIAGLCGRLG
jgi:hypothetical protein